MLGTSLTFLILPFPYQTCRSHLAAQTEAWKENVTVSAGTAAGFLAIRDSSETCRLQESQAMCPYEPAEDDCSLDGALRNLGFVLQTHIFNTLETPAFLSSLIIRLGQSTCNFPEKYSSMLSRYIP